MAVSARLMLLAVVLRPAGAGHCFVGDVLAAPGAGPADALDGGVGLELGGGDRIAKGGDGQHSPAGGDDLAIDELRAGVEDFHVLNRPGFFEAADRTALLVVTWVTFARHHDADA